MSKRKLVIKDTTFRDGVQAEEVEATDLAELLRAVCEIDKLGVHYHEVGFASANRAAFERIKAACELPLSGKVAAFGRTNPNDVTQIIHSGAPVGVLVCKSRASDVVNVLHWQLDDALAIISSSIKQLVSENREVIYDAEHFFQAFLEDDRNFALQTLERALQAGARWLVLCDTNGAMSPQQIGEVVAEVGKIFPLDQLGVHAHNDRGRAVVNAESAWQAGAILVEGTIGGFGERTGNCDLCTLLPNLVVDHRAAGISPEQLRRLTLTYNVVCDVLNRPPHRHNPWVGSSAFYTEAGMHQSGNERSNSNYLHADPAIVGNHERVGVTDQSGRANLVAKASELGLKLPPEKLPLIAESYQKLVDNGADFGLADASFYLFLLRQLDELPGFFEPVDFRLVDEKEAGLPITSQAVLRTKIGDEQKLEVADGDGPVNALDEVLRRTLRKRYPELMHTKLTNFKVRIVDAIRGTAAKVRVRITFSDGKKSWTTMAVHENILEAAWQALTDGYIYKLLVNGHDQI